MPTKNNPPPTIEYILLGLLYQESGHGYDLHKRIQDIGSLSQIWQVKRSKLYYLLEKLEKQKLLKATYISSKNSPGRKEYQLTEKGKAAFITWVETPIEKARNLRIVFLARLHFSLQLGEEQPLRLIAAQRDKCQTWIDNLQSQLNAAKESDFITQQAFIFRIGQIQAMQAWLDGCEASLQSAQPDPAG